MLAVTCAFILAPAASETRASPSPLVDQINHVRRAHGLHPMRYSRGLSGSSARFARRLAHTQRLSHALRVAASGRFSSLGEVLAAMGGWQVRRSPTLAYWLRSSTHRAVLLSPTFRYIGAARARGHFAGSRTTFWTVQLGR
jgi:uncharacterized protein YkwD